MGGSETRLSLHLLAWDFFLGPGLLFAARVLKRGGAIRIRISMYRSRDALSDRHSRPRVWAPAHSVFGNCGLCLRPANRPCVAGDILLSGGWAHADDRRAEEHSHKLKDHNFGRCTQSHRRTPGTRATRRINEKVAQASQAIGVFLKNSPREIREWKNLARMSMPTKL